MRRITATCIGVALALTLGMATKAEAQATNPFVIDGTVTDAANSKASGEALHSIDKNGNQKETRTSSGI